MVHLNAVYNNDFTIRINRCRIVYMNARESGRIANEFSLDVRGFHLFLIKKLAAANVELRRQICFEYLIQTICQVLQDMKPICNLNTIRKNVLDSFCVCAGAVPRNILYSGVIFESFLEFTAVPALK